MNVLANAAAVLFAIAGLVALVALVTHKEPVLLAVGLLLASIGGLVVALARVP